MTITRERFDMALDRMKGADWEQFERLASTFLASEYPALRTMASASGDGGRDSELFAEASEPTTAMQYSVAQDWKSKIRNTKKRISATFPNVSNLVYMTNQVIGADADLLRKELRVTGIYLDIRDRSWFLERANLDRNREEAAEAVARKFVDPLLSDQANSKNMVAGLDDEDARTALIFLEMQVQDTNRSLGLTKASFDTLTLAALRDTSTSKRLGRDAVVSRVQSFLPSHPSSLIRMKVEASLKRLMQKSIRNRKDTDEFHLLDSEIARVSGSMARISVLRRSLDADITNIANGISAITISDIDALVFSARRLLEVYFLRKGEDFARAAAISEPHVIDEITLKSVAAEITIGPIGIKGRPTISVLVSVLETLLSTPSESTSAYLRVLLESYTLFAFLAATPDVQKATRNMFGNGEIWLDTSVLLPLIAESTMSIDARPFTHMFRQARNAGLTLYVTSGVLEEIERHLNRSKLYPKSRNWEGNVPFVYTSYVISGGNPDKFSSWLENFVGANDPIQDIADYLVRVHHIILEDADAHEDVSPELAADIRSIWQAVHTERRANADQQSLRLAAHDAETYLHVLSSRIKERGKSPLGYTKWWLTLDTKARKIMDRVEAHLRPAINIGPVLSIDYLIRYLSFGPSRERVDVTSTALSKIYADTLVDAIPVELIALVSELRTQHADLPENIVQRRIRDTLNHERSRLGLIDAGGPINPGDLIDAVY